MQRVNISKSALVILSVSVLFGCNNMSFKTNVSEAADYRYKSTTVDIYEPSEVYRHDNVPLGEVVASYCRDSYKPDLTDRASLFDLKKNLKVQTAEIGGNALVITQCGEGSLIGCSVYQECRGLAYEIK
ncbi:hypothetical protein [Shewanella donghaensis]|uniref:hypothetical protein n=1 Tax=Shewanella donghaensis TaxID=238836 RepID=UPI001182B687|nr:hypothetical protein [Shewanella donghaensis]